MWLENRTEKDGVVFEDELDDFIGKAFAIIHVPLLVYDNWGSIRTRIELSNIDVFRAIPTAMSVHPRLRDE